MIHGHSTTPVVSGFVCQNIKVRPSHDIVKKGQSTIVCAHLVHRPAHTGLWTR